MTVLHTNQMVARTDFWNPEESETWPNIAFLIFIANSKIWFLNQIVTGAAVGQIVWNSMSDITIQFRVRPIVADDGFASYVW